MKRKSSMFKGTFLAILLLGTFNLAGQAAQGIESTKNNNEKTRSVESKKSSHGFTIEELVQSLDRERVKYEYGDVKMLTGKNYLKPVLLGMLGCPVAFLGGLFFLVGIVSKDFLTGLLGGAVSLSGITLFLYACWLAKQKYDTEAMPIIVMNERGISYQKTEDAPAIHATWSDVDDINTQVRSWLETSYNSAPSFYSDGTIGATMIPKDRIVSDRDIALRRQPCWRTIFIPESKVPVSFEEFYDLVVPHFWEPKEKK